MRFLLAIAALVAAWTACAQGTSEAILSYNGGSLIVIDVSGTAGWTFQPTSPITVTDLGCLDEVFVRNPTVALMEVGLWAPNGLLLASNSITPGSTLFNQSRYESITPVLLDPGQTYHLGAYSPTGGIFLGHWSNIPGFGWSISTSPEIQVGSSAYNTAGFGFPPEEAGSGGSIYAGPNLRYQGGVPEPHSGLLLGLGGLLIAARRWNQRP